MAQPCAYPLLDRIQSPADLRSLDRRELAPLANELRQFMIQSVAATGGHLAAGLGVVELTVALHRVFNTPDDRLVWDVGHQCYPHKILTGRRDRMPTLRQKDGLAGFPKRAESPYDSFGVGHSSTSISAALGMAMAARHQDAARKVVAIIGDGAMTAGMAFEALNHAGDMGLDLLVVLNDNEMSISRNVGALSSYLAKLFSGRLYSSVREGSKKVLAKVPPMFELARRTEEHMKGMVVPGTLFEELGFNYLGPVDGHNITALIDTLGNMSKLPGPQFLHVVTRKGKGYPPAEDNPCAYHGVTRFDSATGMRAPSTPAGPTYTEVFGQWLCDMAEQDPRLVAITPAMREGSGLVSFSERFPDRYIDTGIAEQHAMTLAAGLASDGLKPVVAIYSTFLQRAYDQLIHDVALQNLPVVLAIDRAGIVGPDGPTHAGSFDLSFLRCIPNLLIMAPSDERECRSMLNTAFAHSGPAAVRYPRGRGPGAAPGSDLEPIAIGRGVLCRAGRETAILAFGAVLAAAQEAAEQCDASVANMRFVKPLDEELVLQLAADHTFLVTVEDNAVAGGAGAAVQECLARHGVAIPVLQLGLPDRFLEQATREQLLRECGLDSAGILRAVQAHYPSVGDCKQGRSRLIS